MLDFVSYGQDIDDEDLISCYQEARRYIHDVVQAHGDGPIPPSVQLHWAHESAALTLHHSSRMTYDNLSSVILGIEVFQLTYGYFVTNFEIVDRTRGQIGSGEIRFVGDRTLSQPGNLTSPTLPIVDLSTSSNNTAVSDPPTPPFLWPIPRQPALFLNFRSFGRAVEQDDILSCYINAANYISQQIGPHGDRPIPRQATLHWTHGSASLTVSRRPILTYGVLADVLGGLLAFQVHFGFTEAFCAILQDGTMNLGSVTVVSRPAPRGGQAERVTSLFQIDQVTNISTSLGAPIDPTTIRVRDTPITITFSAFGRSVPSEDFLIAVNQITFRIIDELVKGGKDHLIGKKDLEWKWHRALMVVNTYEHMTWGMLGTVVEGITAFAIRFGWLSCDFLAAEDIWGGIGNGFISLI